MAGIKCRHCSKICVTTREMTKHILACKINQGKARCTILRDIPYNTNHFPASPKVKAILESTEKGDYENLHLANFDRRYSDKNC